MLGHDWDFLFQRTQHLAQGLAKYARVTYLGTFLSYLRRLYDLATLQGQYPHWFARNISKNLKSIPARNWLPHRSALHSLIADLSIGIPFDYYIKSNDVKFDLLIATNPKDLPLVRKIPYRLLCYDCFDNNPEFFADNKRRREATAKQEAQLMAMADFVIVSSPLLYDRKRRGTKAIYLIPNGVDANHFRPSTEGHAIPQDIVRFVNARRPIAGYHGVIDHWFDVDLLANTALACPEIIFVLIGTVKTDVSQMERLPNVHLLGAKPYAILPTYLRWFNVGLIPFRMNELTLTVDPIKAYEYFGCGLPVVSVPLPEMKRKAPLATLASTPAEFVEAIRYSLREQDQRQRDSRIAYAGANSWQSRIDIFFSIVQSFATHH